jgi:hypothetical protein
MITRRGDWDPCNVQENPQSGKSAGRVEAKTCGYTTRCRGRGAYLKIEDT